MLKRYLAGAAAARTGDEMSGPALLLVGLAATGSGASASALLAGLMIAAAVGGPVFGAFLDRSRRPGRLLARALLAYASALLLILLCLGRLPLATVVAIAVAAGLLGPALSGGWTAQLPLVTGDLPRANALDAMTFNVAALAGPALAGVIAALAGAPAAMIASAAMIAFALPVARALPARPRPDAPSTTAGEPRLHGDAAPLHAGAAPAGVDSRLPPTGVAPSGGSAAGRPGRGRERLRTAWRSLRPIRAELLAGVRAIKSSRALAAATGVSVVSCVGQGVFLSCVPLLGEWVFGAAERGALLLSVVAVAALAANALLARRPSLLRADTVVWGSTLVLGFAFLLAATQNAALVVLAAFLVGVGEGPQLTALFAVRHREAPERLRGQVFTTGASLKITGYAVGAGVAGPLAAWSLPGALVVAAATQGVAALVGQEERVTGANSRR